MKIKHLLLTLAVTIIFISQASAQAWSQFKYEFYYGLGATNFMGDVAAPSDPSRIIWMHFFNTMGIKGNAGLRYQWKEQQYLSANFSFGQLYAKDPVGDPDYYDANRTANSFFTELSVRYEYLVVKEKTKKTVYKMLGENSLKNINIPTYLFIGAGGTYNIGSFTRVGPDGAADIIDERISNFALIVPLGVGIKTRLSNVSYLNLEATIYLTSSDGLDWATKNIKENGITIYKGDGGDWIDQYQSITINYIHKLRANKKGLPKFKRR